MKKVGCAKCGGTMKNGGSTTNKLNNPKGYAPAQTGGDNTKMGIYGVPNAGRTDSLGFKKGGSVKMKTGGVAKAKFGATVNVQRGYPGKIRSANDQGYTAIGKREPARTKFAKGGTTKKLVKAQTGRTIDTTGYSKGMQTYNKNNYNELLTNKKGSGYYAGKSGVITKSERTGDSRTLYNKSIDTTGYSKGRTNFELDRDIDNGRITGSTSIKRSQVIPTINKWKQEVKPNPTKVNTNSAGTKTVVHTGADGKKHVKVTNKEGKTSNKTMKMGGSLKPVPSDKANSLGKLPTAVRNKMGFQRKGGTVKKK